jgi:hypothetical protein
MIYSDDEIYKSVKWNYMFLSANPNINMKIINENPIVDGRFWSFNKLSSNKMDYYNWDFVKSRNCSYPYILK